MPFSPGAVLLLWDLDDRILADVVLLFQARGWKHFCGRQAAPEYSCIFPADVL